MDEVDPAPTHRKFSELIRDSERRRIWAALEGWTETVTRLDAEGKPVPVKGFDFKPLSPFFDELHAIVFPDEYLSDDEVLAQFGDPPWLTKEESDEVLSDLDTAQQALHVIAQLATGNLDPWTWPGTE